MSDEPCRWGAVDPVAVRFAFGLLNEFMLRRDRKELRCGDVRKLRKQADVRRGFQLLGRERRWQRYFRGVKKDWMDQEVEKDSILAIGPRWRICSWSLWSRPLANGWLQPDIKI